jgi:peroxiredoxin
MVETKSTMLPLGTAAPDFSLPGVYGGTLSLSDVTAEKGMLMIFMCNHCPFVVHIADKLAELAKEYQAKGINFVGISSNDVETHPDDSFEKMKAEAEARGYEFAYLFDDDQSVAKAYKAACTPDFFLFDSNKKLAYRGQLDSSRPGNGIPVTGEDLTKAMDQLISGEEVPADQTPSIGCNIKWKSGNAPAYFGN